MDALGFCDDEESEGVRVVWIHGQHAVQHTAQHSRRDHKIEAIVDGKAHPG